MILGILQARVSSTRLPGKVLEPVLGEPMIARQLERLVCSRHLDKLVVAISSDSADDRLEVELAARGFEVRRGPLDDVVTRFETIVAEFQPDHLVRLTADCPLTDPGVIDVVIESHQAAGADYTSNTLEPTYPDGLDAEVVSVSAWQRLVAIQLTPKEREHVTLGLYSRPDQFVLHSVRQEVDRSGLRWTVDVPDDLAFVRQVYEQLYHVNPEFAQEDVASLLARKPELNRTDADEARNAGLAAG